MKYREACFLNSSQPHNQSNSVLFPCCVEDGKTVWARLLPSAIRDPWIPNPIFRRDQFIPGDDPIGTWIEHGHLFAYYRVKCKAATAKLAATPSLR